MNEKIHWPDVVVVIGCILAYMTVAIVDDVANEKAVAHEKARADAYQQAMIACLNSGGFYFKDTQRAYICSAKEI